MAATVVAKIGASANLRLFKCGKKVVETLGSKTGISIADAAEIARYPICDTGELMRCRELVPIIARGTKNGRPVSFKFLSYKDNWEEIMAGGKISYDGVEYPSLTITSRRQILK